MLVKWLTVLIVLVLLWMIFFHRAIPGLTRKLGRSLGELRKAGEEIIDDEEVPGSPLARYEEQAGEAVTAQLLAENPLSTDLRLQERVARIGARLAAAASRREVRFRFAVLEAPETNAYAIPGGAVFITRPLVALCGGDDNRLAGILGHEVAHIDLRHAVKSYAARAAARTGMRLLTFGRGAIIGQLAGGLQELVTRGYTRERELEADAAGARLAGKAGYDPLALARLFRDLRERPGAAGIPSFFRSHPPLADRIRELENRGRLA